MPNVTVNIAGANEPVSDGTINADNIVGSAGDDYISVDGAAFTLTQASPAGGTFSGPGIVGNDFNPGVAGVGIHTISYDYTDGFGCSATAIQTVTVNGLPTVTFDPIPGLCAPE